MAKSPIERTLDKVGNVIQDIFTGPSEPPVVTKKILTGQTCLERLGMDFRKSHLLRNEWRKDFEYSKPLVLAEYEIQTEFKVSTTDEPVLPVVNDNSTNEQKTVKSKKEKREKKKEKESNTVKGVDVQPGGDNTKTEPAETTTQPDNQNDWVYY